MNCNMIFNELPICYYKYLNQEFKYVWVGTDVNFH